MMNYESNAFQDYESITIDELKEQTNNLLDRVIEEQRPLRVCMDNDKELLLFPQDLLAPIRDADFRLILLSAMRYAMGRNTYMPAVVSDYIKRHLRFLDDKFHALAMHSRWKRKKTKSLFFQFSWNTKICSEYHLFMISMILLFKH